MCGRFANQGFRRVPACPPARLPAGSGECAYSGRDTGQPNRVLANAIAGNNTKRWPGACKVRLAAAEHERAEVETILVNETEIGEARRQEGTRNVDLALDVLLQPPAKRVD